MTDEIISVRVSKETKQQMKLHDEINWSAVIRKAIQQSLAKDSEEKMKKAKEAAKEIDKISKSGVFSGGKTGTEIIREWRNKRRL